MRHRLPPLALLAAGAMVALLVLLPLAETLLRAGRIGATGAASLLLRPLVGVLLYNTLILIAAATLAAGLLGTAAAWCVERTALPGRGVWGVLAAAPLAIPAFVTSYAWVSLSPGLQDFNGALLVVTCAYYPLVYLPVAAALRGLDPALEESARVLGAGAWGCFFRIVLPQLRPALLGGMLLVALNTLTEFGAFALLRYRTFTTEIYAEYRVSFDGAGAAVLAAVLLLLCLLCLLAEEWLRGRARYGRLGQGTRRAARPQSLGRGRIPVLAAFALLVAITLGVPLGTLLFWLTQHATAATAPAGTAWGPLLAATAASLGLGLGGAALTLLFALPLGVLATRYDGPLITLLERCAYLAQGVPGLVVALALISLTLDALRPLYQSTALLLLAYAIVFLPLALVGVRAALLQAQPALEEAGRALGLGWLALARRVILPLAGPGLAAAAAMVFVSVVSELTATLLLAPIGTRTLATQVWADTATLAFAAAAPYAALMTALSLLSAWLLARRFGRGGIFAVG